MIVVDTSALIAMLQNEPERAGMAAIAARADRRLVSTVSLLEAGMIALSRRGAAGLSALDAVVQDLELEIIPFDDPQRQLALQAFGVYGKGIHPKAKLNFGDCAVYALAKGTGAALLYKGDDFSATDLQAAT